MGDARACNCIQPDLPLGGRGRPAESGETQKIHPWNRFDHGLFKGQSGFFRNGR